MKAPILLRRVVLLLLLTAPTALAGDQLFDSLKLGDKTVTDAIVTDVTPTHVTVTYDGGTSKIKRQDLPPELKSLYPYDAKAAADYEKRQGKVLFDSLKVGDTTVTNVRVKDPTPTRVTVVFDGGCSRLKRQDLPDELKALYPYDPKEAAEYEKQQSSKQDEASADARANKRLRSKSSVLPSKHASPTCANKRNNSSGRCYLRKLRQMASRIPLHAWFWTNRATRCRTLSTKSANKRNISTASTNNSTTSPLPTNRKNSLPKRIAPSSQFALRVSAGRQAGPQPPRPTIRLRLSRTSKKPRELIRSQRYNSATRLSRTAPLPTPRR